MRDVNSAAPHETSGAQEPAQPTVPQYPQYAQYPQPEYPLAGQGTSATAQSSAPNAPTYGTNYGWASTSAPDLHGAPPAYTPPVYSPPPPRRRRTWLALGSVVGVIALLLLGIIVATATFGNRGATPTIGAPGNTVAPTVAVPAAAADLQQTVINVIHTVQPSVVEVRSSGGGQGAAVGSGEIVTSNGYIVTNDHVVAGFSTFTVTFADGTTKPATIVGQAPGDDLAVLKVNATNLQAINFGSSAKVQVGQFVVAIGSPLGLDQSATFGIVSALNRSQSEGPGGTTAQLIGLIQTSAPINPGNSGGALVDLSGKLIGIPTLGAVNTQSGTAANGIGFAIPSDRVKYVVDQLIKNGRLTNTGRGFLGVRGQDVTPQLAAANKLPVQSGVIITGFANDTSGKSPAQAAGLQNGDIITEVNGQAISGNGALASALMSQAPGTQVTLKVVRKAGGTQTITVTLGERPANLNG